MASLRNTIIKTQEKIKNDIQAILHDKDNQKYFQETIITQRNNRYVIPVKQNIANILMVLFTTVLQRVKPSILNRCAWWILNNELQEALIGEEQEVLRIYRELSALVKQHSNDLMDACEKVSHIELYMVKASLAIAYQGVPAILSTDRTVNLMRARHPLIPPNVVVPTKTLY